MENAIIACKEDEVAPFWSILWRWPKGWRPDLLALRGPGPVPGLLLSLLGIWRFTRPACRWADEPRPDFQGACLCGADVNLGSYGMGGSGFLGFKLKPKGSSRPVWLVITLWSAVDWVLQDGSPLGEDKLRGLIGSRVSSLQAARDFFEIVLTQGSASHTLRIDRQSRKTSPWGVESSKRLADGESLLDAVVISRKAALWF